MWSLGTTGYEREREIEEYTVQQECSDESETIASHRREYVCFVNVQLKNCYVGRRLSWKLLPLNMCLVD